MRFLKYLVTFLVVSSFTSFNNALIPKQQRVRCHDHEKAALLQFKQSFLIDCNVSTPSFAYPKTKSWQERVVMTNRSSVVDCCTWDGVECSTITNFVIGLDLSSSCLYGTFPSNSTLFSLDHLKELDLRDNDFNHSPIPSYIGQISSLRSLLLSYSRFRGLIPPEISLLSSLSTLALSSNRNPVVGGPCNLALGDLSLEKLVTNMTRLTQLYLNYINISSVVPFVLSNMTSLVVMSLSGCQLHGELPHGIFQLPHLKELYVNYNPRLEGHLPEFGPNSPLNILDFQTTGLSGKLPSSIGKLGRLEQLLTNGCSFSGHIPASLGNLTELIVLDLDNAFTGTMPPSLTNLTNLVSLSLSGLDVSPTILDSWLLKLKLTYLSLVNMIMGKTIPSSLANITTLSTCSLQSNQLFGTLPSWFANLTQLKALYLGDNQLEGSVQPWLSKLVNLQQLDLSYTNLLANFEQFFELPDLQYLYLGSVNLMFLPNVITIDSSLAQLTSLELSSCNLTEFPRILKTQNSISGLSMEENQIAGHVPHWFMDTNKESLVALDLSYNSLVGFEQPAVFLPWTNLELFILKGNKLRGLLPIPLNTTQVYDISDNNLYEAIPDQICLANSLTILDLSNNSMSGHIPQCVGHQLGNSLQVLNLRGNSFHGTIPKSFGESCSLMMINLSDNQLEGKLPRSLLNCTMLEVLDLGKNRLSDTFPFWLGRLSALQVLVLRHNGFHGKIRDDLSSHAFKSLRIIDVSYNFHVASLPSSYFQNWRAMQVTSENHLSSSKSVITISYRHLGVASYYTSNYVITITNKGTDTRNPEFSWLS